MSDMIYHLDREDRIVFVNEEWDRFAKANSGQETTSQLVLNRPLWDFIVDATTRELYRQALQRIRAGQSIQFTFRCDSPSCRRLLEMYLKGGENGIVEIRTRTLSEEQRETPALNASESASSEELLRVCGWCNKIFDDGAWVEFEEALELMGLFELENPPTMTHGICEACYRTMRKTFNAP